MAGAWGLNGEFSCRRVPNSNCLCRGSKFVLGKWPPMDFLLRAIAKGSLTCWEHRILLTQSTVVKYFYIQPNQRTPFKHLQVEKCNSPFLYLGRPWVQAFFNISICIFHLLTKGDVSVKVHWYWNILELPKISFDMFHISSVSMAKVTILIFFNSCCKSM